MFHICARNEGYYISLIAEIFNYLLAEDGLPLLIPLPSVLDRLRSSARLDASLCFSIDRTDTPSGKPSSCKFQNTSSDLKYSTVKFFRQVSTTIFNDYFYKLVCDCWMYARQYTWHLKRTVWSNKGLKKQTNEHLYVFKAWLNRMLELSAMLTVQFHTNFHMYNCTLHNDLTSD